MVGRRLTPCFKFVFGRSVWPARRGCSLEGAGEQEEMSERSSGGSGGEGRGAAPRSNYMYEVVTIAKTGGVLHVNM